MQNQSIYLFLWKQMHKWLHNVIPFEDIVKELSSIEWSKGQEIVSFEKKFLN